jgi:hypothetical protein
MKCLDLGIVTIALIMRLTFWIIGWSIGHNGMKDQAISAGVAHYTVNSTNGIVTFEFKKPL